MPLRLPGMSHADRLHWQAARTLNDLGQLTAAWLEGVLQSQPGYQPRCGPDDETLPYVPILAAANRAGYLTTASQPGAFCTSTDGTAWAQRAAVEGFICDPVVLRGLIHTANRAGLEVIIPAHREEKGRGAGAVVTLRENETHTTFGLALTIQDLAVQWHGFPHALTIVAGAVQVTVADPLFGPSTRLWDVLTNIGTQVDVRSET